MTSVTHKGLVLFIHWSDIFVIIIMFTPRNNGRLEDEVRHISVEDLDEHAIHVMSFDTVPEKRNKD